MVWYEAYFYCDVCIEELGCGGCFLHYFLLFEV